MFKPIGKKLCFYGETVIFAPEIFPILELQVDVPQKLGTSKLRSHIDGNILKPAYLLMR